MSEKIEISELGNFQSPAGSALLTVISAYCGGKTDLLEEFKDPILEVSLVINGVEVSIKPYFERFVKDWDYQVKMAAKSLIDERLNKLEDRLYDFNKSVDELLRKSFPELDFEGDY